MSTRWSGRSSIAALAPLVIVVVLGGGCSHTSTPRRPGEEFLRRIEFEGNQQLRDGALVEGLALRRTRKRGGAPDPYTIEVDADRIKGEYLRRGYLDVDVRPRVEREGDATTVIYTVEEGVRARTRVVITGLPPEVSPQEVRRLIPLPEGAPFDYAVFDAAKESLEVVVKDAGYAHAELDATVIADRAANTATIQLDYTPGPKARFGAIAITGVEGELRDAVANRLAFTPGQPYSIAAIIRSQRALYGLSRFSTVQVNPADPTSPDPVIAMKVDVAQGARHEVRLGGGFGLDPASYEIRGRAGYSVAGWLLPLNTLTVELRPAYALLRDGTDYEPRLRALARVERTDLLWTASKGEVEAAYNYVAYEAYTAYGPRVRLGVSSQVLTERIQLRVGWGFGYAEFRNVHPLLDAGLQMAIGIDRAERVGTLQQAVIVDLRDHPIETKLGGYAELRVAEGTRVAGSDYAFVEVVPELRGFVPLGRRGWWRTPVLAARVRAGAIFGDLAPTERLFAGGASSHRGFGERDLAPAAIGEFEGDLRSIPYGGGALLLAGIEARIPITTFRTMPVGGVVFLDGGDVTEKVSQLDLADLHWALGGGLRLDTIVGPVRADLGFRLNRMGGTNPEPQSTFAFHLSLGEAF